MSELKRCPFCGGEAEFVRDIERKDVFQSSDYVYVRCKECHAQTLRIYYSAEFHKLDEEYDESQKAWNTRKPVERILERLETEYQHNVGRLKMISVDKAIEIVKEEGGL